MKVILNVDPLITRIVDHGSYGVVSQIFLSPDVRPVSSRKDSGCSERAGDRSVASLCATLR